MTQVLSSVFRVEVVASSGSLASQVASMSSGTWALWPSGNMPANLVAPSSLDLITSNGSRVHWDNTAGRRRLMYCGKAHGSAYESRMLDCNDSSTPTWTSDVAPIPDGIATVSHQFNGQTAHPSNGDLYACTPYKAHLWRRAGGANSWTDLGPPPSGNHGSMPTSVFCPTYGTAGGVFIIDFYGIDVWNIGTSSWSTLWPGYGSGGINIGDGVGSSQGLAFYDVAAQSVFHINPNRTMYKIANNGTFTTRNNAPTTVCIPIAGNIGSDGITVDGYTSDLGTVRKPLIVQHGGTSYEYTSATDTWAAIPGGNAPTGGVDNNANAAGYCPVYDCVLLYFQGGTAGTFGMSAAVYKR